MQVSIDNLAGAGPIDYTASVEASDSLGIQRQLNAPSECSFAFLPDAQNLPVPSRYARVVVNDSRGLVLFTGYVVAPPAMILTGAGTKGPSYKAMVMAVSDELLTDSVLTVNKGTALNQPLAQAAQSLARLAGAAPLTLSGNTNVTLVGRYEVKQAATWSANVSSLASSSRSCYRVVDGVTTLTAVGSVVHTLSEESGTLQLGELSMSAVKLLANDVTVCGKVEPAAYVSEFFQGDGITTVFNLTNLPFEPIASEKLSFRDLFQGATLNSQVWQSVDPASRLSITSNGLSCAGGTGSDGQTVVSAIQQIELGGSVVVQAGGVQASPGSAGTILGLYSGPVSIENCFAGFQISGADGLTQVGALVEGTLSGNAIGLVTGHLYTFRLRVYCAEMERVQPSYYFLDSDGTGLYGGQTIVSPGQVRMEVQDVTGGIAGAVEVLYAGALSALPAACTIGLLDSGSLSCSVKTFSCTQAAPLWVTVAPGGGAPSTQVVDMAASGGSCKVASTGKLTFYTGNVPPAEAVICIRYRTRHQAVARRSIGRSTTGEGTSSATPNTQMWVGTVTEPAAWSSADCDNAAAALLKSSAVASAAWQGTYTGWNLETNGDVWPGDVLAITSASAGTSASVVVRKVQIVMGSAAPQRVKYKITFANDWAEDLAIKLSATVPVDTWLPTAPTEGATLDNLVTLAVGSVSGSQITVNAGVMPPAGGGFEVKRKDWTFGPGYDSDLVMRSPVPNFIIPREAAMEQYYIRMFDGSTPPNYSQMSAAVYVNVPL